MTFQQPAGSIVFDKAQGLFLPQQYHKLISAKEIGARVKAIAAVTDPHMMRMRQLGFEVVSVALLDGAVSFYQDWRTQLSFMGHLPILLPANSYDAGQSGPLRIDKSKLSRQQIAGKVVYLIDDLVDTGQSMVKVSRALYDLGAALVITIVLLDKTVGRAPEYDDFTPDIAGYIIPDAWVFGYNMDDSFLPGKAWNGTTWPLDNSWVRNLRDVYYYGDIALKTEVKVIELDQLILPEPEAA